MHSRPTMPVPLCEREAFEKGPEYHGRLEVVPKKA